MNFNVLGQRLVAGIFPGPRAAKRKRQEARSVLAGFNHHGCVGGGDFPLKFRIVRMHRSYRGANDERRRPGETGFCNQDGRTVWYAL